MKALIVGFGSIGQRHGKNLEKMNIDFSAYDIETCFSNMSLEKAMQGKDAILVCTPPSTHIEIALKAVKAGKHVFIEKPLSNDVKGIDELMKVAKEKQLTVMVGYQMRLLEDLHYIKFLLGEKKIGSVMSVKAEFGHYLPYWRPNLDYTKNYTSRNDLGGGILLDSSHEIDYLISIFGDIEEVFCNSGKISDLKVDVEDTVDILLKFKNGIFGNVHLDFTNRVYSRFCKIIGTEGTMIWDVKEHMIVILKEKEKQRRRIVWQDNVYLDEIEQFLTCIKLKKQPLSNLDTAKKTLDVVLACKKSAKTGKVMKL